MVSPLSRALPDCSNGVEGVAGVGAAVPGAPGAGADVRGSTGRSELVVVGVSVRRSHAPQSAAQVSTVMMCFMSYIVKLGAIGPIRVALRTRIGRLVLFGAGLALTLRLGRILIV